MSRLLYIDDIGGLMKFALLLSVTSAIILTVFLYKITKSSKYKTAALVLTGAAVFLLTMWLILNEIIDKQ